MLNPNLLFSKASLCFASNKYAEKIFCLNCNYDEVILKHLTNGLQKIFLTSFEGSDKTTKLTETFFEKLD